MKIRIAISGRSYDTAEKVPSELLLDDGASLDDALKRLADSLPEGQSLPRSCLLAISGRHVGTLANHAAHPIKDGDEMVLIAPVAGG